MTKTEKLAIALMAKKRFKTWPELYPQEILMIVDAFEEAKAEFEKEKEKKAEEEKWKELKEELGEFEKIAVNACPSDSYD